MKRKRRKIDDGKFVLKIIHTVTIIHPVTVQSPAHSANLFGFQIFLSFKYQTISIHFPIHVHNVIRKLGEYINYLLFMKKFEKTVRQFYKSIIIVLIKAASSKAAFAIFDVKNVYYHRISNQYYAKFCMIF